MSSSISELLKPVDGCCLVNVFIDDIMRDLNIVTAPGFPTWKQCVTLCTAFELLAVLYILERIQYQLCPSFVIYMHCNVEASLKLGFRSELVSSCLTSDS